MVTLKEIMKGINLKLKENFPNVPLLSTDVREGIERSCFYVNFLDVSTTPLNDSYIQKTIDVTIYYFPEDREKYRLDVLEKQDIIESSFVGSLRINDDFSVMIEEVKSHIEDDILECGFEITYLEAKPDSGTSILIGDLIYNGKPIN